MRLRFYAKTRQRIGSEHGAVAVEFAILLPVLALLVFGMIDFGHSFFMRHIISNASREGARYGSRYNSDASGAHLKPNQLSPTIIAWVTDKYSGNLPSDANLTVDPANETLSPGFASGIAGDDLAVKVSATKHWFVLGKLIPTFGTTQTISVTTTMKIE